MRAILCDKCGKTMLMEDRPFSMLPRGFHRLINDKDDTSLDLCEDCANELLAAVREVKGGGC